MRILATLLLASQVLFSHAGKLLADEKTPPEKRASETQHLVVTVLGRQIYLEQITPVEAPTKQKKLSVADYQKWLRDYRTQQLMSRVSGQVLKEYAHREKLSPSDQEIEELIREAALKYSGNFGSDADSQQKLELQVKFLIASSCEWRTAKALHQRYGGRVAISSFGAWASIEGRNAVFKEYAAAGDITFADADLEAAFWEKTKDKRVLDVTVPADRVAAHFAVSPWQQWIGEQAFQAAEAKKMNSVDSKPLPTKPN